MLCILVHTLTYRMEIMNFYDIDRFYRISKMKLICQIVYLPKTAFVQSCSVQSMFFELFVSKNGAFLEFLDNRFLDKFLDN